MKKAGHSMSSWAKENKYDPDFVGQIVYRWAGKTGIPRGEPSNSNLFRRNAWYIYLYENRLTIL